MSSGRSVVPHFYDVPDPRTKLLHFEVYRDKLCDLIRQYLDKVDEAAQLRQTSWQDREPFGLLPGEHAFVIGIHGPWGCGKSTLMTMIQRRLSRDRFPSIRGKEPPLTVEFQAWKYSQREELWRALLSRVVQTAEKELDRQSGARGAEAAGEDEKKKKIEELEGVCEAIKNSLYRDYEHTRSGPMTLNWSALPGLMVTLGKSWFGKPEFATIAEQFYSIFERKKIKEFHDRIRDLDQFQEWFRKLQEGLQLPWLILIDDLDRCLPEAAIEIFEATKVFLDAPKVVFVLALDKETIRRGLRVRYKEKAGEKPLVDPDLYIEKVTNISFVIPTLSEGRVRDLIGSEEKDWKDRADGWSDPQVESVFESLLGEQERHLQPNPRRWIRLLNTALLYTEMRRELESESGEPALEPRAEKAFLKMLCLSYRWGGFMDAALNSWEVMVTFEAAAAQAERDFEKFKTICSEKYPSLRLYAEDADLFQLLLTEPKIADPKPGKMVMQLF